MARRLFRLIRRHVRGLALLLLLLSLALPLPTHSDTLDCLDAARLAIGRLARVAYAPLPQISSARPLRDFPGSDAPVIAAIPPGESLLVMRGPVCLHSPQPANVNAKPSIDTTRDYDFWWQVQTSSGRLGWMADTVADDTTVPALEAWQSLIDLVRPIPDGVAVLRVNAHGLARWLTGYATPLPVDGGQSQFPMAELTPLLDAFAHAQRLCPQQAHIADPPPNARVAAYPSPDSTRLLLVRHLWRTAVLCDGSQTARYGLDRLSLIDPHGETVQFDVPAHAPFVPLSGDSAQVNPFNPEPNQIASVIWSPDNIKAAVTIRYGHQTQLAVLDTRDGMLTFLDDGFGPHWAPDGLRLSWLRPDPNSQTVNLISAAPDNAARQTLTLPSALWYSDAPLPPVWNHDGTRLAVCVRVNNCASLAVIDVQGRRTLAPLPVPPTSAGSGGSVAGVFAVRWALNDSALLWIAPDRLTLQAIDGTAARPLPVILNDSEQIVTVYLFPGAATESALLVLQMPDGSLRYQLLNLRNAASGKVTFTP
jgi:hypothetical protein